MAFAAETAMTGLEKLGEMLTDEILKPLDEFRQRIQEVANVITPFVDAISPSTVQDFNRAMKDMLATVGSALTPALQVLSATVREVSGVILPLMQKLQPIFTSLAESLGSTLASSVRVLTDSISGSVGMFGILSEAVAQVAAIYEELSTVIGAGLRTFSKLFSDLFGGPGAGKTLTGAMQFLTDVVRQAGEALVKLVANLLALAGFKDTLKTFASSLEAIAKEREVRAPGLTAAANSPQFQDIASIVRQQTLAASIAAGAGGKAPPATTLEAVTRLAEDIKKIADTKRSVTEALTEWWEKTSDDGKPLGQAIAAAKRVGEWTVNFFTNLGNGVAGWIEDLAGRLRNPFGGT